MRTAQKFVPKKKPSIVISFVFLFTLLGGRVNFVSQATNKTKIEICPRYFQKH